MPPDAEATSYCFGRVGYFDAAGVPHDTAFAMEYVPRKKAEAEMLKTLSGKNLIIAAASTDADSDFRPVGGARLNYAH